MANFDKTTVANQAGWQGQVQVKSWTIDVEDMLNKEGFASTDDIQLLEIKAGQCLVGMAGTLTTERDITGTAAVVDIGIGGGQEFASAQSYDATAGTTAAMDVLAAGAGPIYYVNSGTTSVYLTVEPTLTNVTDAGKITVTLAYVLV